MATKQRSDIEFAAQALAVLTQDFSTAVELEAVSEWADALAATAQYLAERFRVIHADDE